MATRRPAAATRHVFINCPFDNAYKPLFDAITFAVHDLGFQARHALVEGGQPLRLPRIAAEIRGSSYSIHDLSRVQRGGALNLPRFNMPFEAGIAYACNQVATSRHAHHLLLLDSQPHRIAASLSDAAGIDGRAHYDDPEQVVSGVRAFLVRSSGQRGLPGAAHVWQRYLAFKGLLRLEARRLNITSAEIRSWDYVNDIQALMVAWIRANRS
jgi:hypothetical protein